MTFKEFKEQYAEIFAFVFGVTRDNEAVFYYLPTILIDEEEFNLLFTNNTFRDSVNSKHVLKKATIINAVSMEELGKLEGENYGYKAETFLFGSPNYTNSLIDGYLQGYPVQVKTSFDFGNGTSNSNNI